MVYDQITIQDIQAKVGANDDGAWGPETVSKLAEWNARHNPNGSLSWAAFKDLWGAMDYDEATIQDIQLKVGSTVDGAWGPATIQLLAAWSITHDAPNLSYSKFTPKWDASPHVCPAPGINNWDIRRAVAADPDRAYLCDISHYQGDLDYSRHIANGIMGTIMRTTIGVYSEDDNWREYWRNLKARNHPVGAYHLMILFWRDKRTDPRPAAEAFVSKMKAAEGGPPDLGYWGDTEHKEVKLLVESHGPESAARWIVEWCDIVSEKTGQPAYLYTSVRVLKLLGDWGHLLKPYAKWWVAYTKEDDDPLPVSDDPWNLPDGFDWIIHQYTSHGINVAVSSKRCDCDVYNGSPDLFRVRYGM